MEKPILIQQQQKQPTQIPPVPSAPPSSTATQQQQQQTQTKHVLFDLTQIETESLELDGKTQKCYTIVKKLIAGKSPAECQAIYQKHLSQNPQQNAEELTMGLLVAILVEPDGQDEFYKDIVTFSKDNLALFTSILNMIIIERMTRLSHHSIKQTFWITDQLIKNGISTAESICSNLMRQTAKGDVSPKNLFMVDNLLSLLAENRSWLINSTSFLGPTVIYNLMRLILDHLPVAHNVIRQKEIDFVLGLIREKFEYVTSIGKDFLRLLNSLQRVGGFTQLYQDIYVNDPKELHPSYEGVKQLFATRTPRRLFQSCLTFDMEKRISYLATQIRFGNQKRTQDVFHKLYLAGSESSWLRSDLIRYICTIIHPSNEVLCSDIIPRWAIIGWLLTTVNHVVIQCGPALFFDWFSFDPKSDNIMNIEPAILVMYYSLRSHPQVTAMLLDYLCRAPSSFSWKLSDTVRGSIKKSFHQILEKRVLPSLTPLFVNPKYDSALKARIKENFPEYCQPDNGITQPQNNGPVQMAAQQQQQQPPPTPPQQQQNTNNTAPTSSQTVMTTPTNEPTIQDASKQQGDVIVVDDSDTNPLPTTQEKTIPFDNTSTVPSLGFQPPMKIHVPTNYSTSKTSTAAKVSTLEPKYQPNPNRNGMDPIEALINVGSTSVVPATKNDTSASNSPTNPSKKTSNSSAIKQEASASEDPLRPTRRSTSASPSIDWSGRETPSSSSETSIESLNGNLPVFQIESLDTSSPRIDANHQSPQLKVIYPFMTVKRTLRDHNLESFSDEINEHLNNMHQSASPQDRASHAQKLLDLLNNNDTMEPDMIDDLGCHFANLISEDFVHRIHPKIRDKLTYESAFEVSPLFVLCQNFISSDQPKPNCKALMTAVVDCFEAASFMTLYFMRITQICDGAGMGNSGLPRLHQIFCAACKRDDPTKCLVEDLKMMSTYDSEMFCFMLPFIFSDFSHTEPYQIINNCELIRLVTSTIDPVSLQEFTCLCLTGSTKIISREDPVSVIETSLSWESMEQYFFWKILTAQSVPIENYLSVLPKLNVKKHPEAMTSIMSNLQKISEPDVSTLQAIIDTHSRQNEQFVGAIIRYWSIRSDLKEMTKNIISLMFDSRPPSPQVKRKGQTKQAAAAAATGGSKSINSAASSSSSSTSTSSCSGSPSSSSTMSERAEKILLILDFIKRRAPRNKLLAQVELLDALSQLESSCNDSLRPKLNLLLQARQRPTKKKKLDKD